MIREEQLIRALRSTRSRVRLTDNERGTMRLALRDAMAKTGVRNETTVFGWSFFRRVPVLSLVLSLGFLSISGVAFAAEKSLPGDALYTVKTRVNEPLVEKLILSSEQKIAWQKKRVERRIAEAEALEKRRGLTPEKKELLEKEASLHQVEFERSVSAVREKNESRGEELEREFENVLSKNATVKAERREERIVIRVVEHEDISDDTNENKSRSHSESDDETESEDKSRESETRKGKVESVPFREIEKSSQKEAKKESSKKTDSKTESSKEKKSVKTESSQKTGSSNETKKDESSKSDEKDNKSDSSEDKTDEEDDN